MIKDLICFAVAAVFLVLDGFSQLPQELPHYSVRVNAAPGEIIRHTKHLNSLGQFQTRSLSLDISSQSDTGMHWAQPHGYPQYGLSFAFQTYKSSYIGYSLAVVPYIEKSVPVFNSRMNFTYHIGCGIGYTDEVFHPVENPNNKTMSTHLNGAVDLRAGFGYRASSNIDLMLEAGLFHLSNGAVRMPNYGANLLQFNTGVKYSFGKNVQAGEKKTKLQPPEVVVIANAGSRLIESTLERYPVQSLLVELNLLNGRGHRLGLGAAVMNDAIRREYYDWAEYYGNGEHQRYKLVETVNYGPYLHYEWVLNKLSTYVHTGIYLAHSYRRFQIFNDYDGNGTKAYYLELNKSYIFNRVGLRYRIMPHLLINFGLKSHGFVAQFFEFGIGTHF